MTARLYVLLFAFCVPAVAVAQVAVTPESVSVALAEGETTEITLTISNGGGEVQPLALSLTPAPDENTPLEPPGTTLFTSEDTCCGLANITSTPEGRLFVTTNLDTYEFSPELEVVNEFRHPISQQIRGTLGIAYDSQNSTLWWLDVQGDLLETEQAVLLEASLDGTETGRSLTVPYAEDGWCGFQTGKPSQLVNDLFTSESGEEGRFYYLDIGHEEVWAMDADGEAVPGYPVSLTDYSEETICFRNGGLDAHALGGEAVLETGIEFPSDDWASRVVVTDRAGRNRGAETPLTGLETPDGAGGVIEVRGVVRSRLDTSIIYITVRTGFAGDVRYWVYAVRAAPLPPVWLRASPILFETEAATDTTLTLTLDAADLEPGVYEAVVSVREDDGIGPVLVDVPVTLTVASVDSEDEAVVSAALQLGKPYPNPASHSVTVPVVLGAATEVRLAVFDVLGREVAALHEGLLAAGDHALALDPATLPNGVYVVRAEVGGEVLTRRLTVLR